MILTTRELALCVASTLVLPTTREMHDAISASMTGVPMRTLTVTVSRMVSEGLLVRTGRRYSLSESGERELSRLLGDLDVAVDLATSPLE